jgi:hypothetical protein
MLYKYFKIGAVYLVTKGNGIFQKGDHIWISPYDGRLRCAEAPIFIDPTHVALQTKGIVCDIEQNWIIDGNSGAFAYNKKSDTETHTFLKPNTIYRITKDNSFFVKGDHIWFDPKTKLMYCSEALCSYSEQMAQVSLTGTAYIIDVDWELLPLGGVFAAQPKTRKAANLPIKTESENAGVHNRASKSKTTVVVASISVALQEDMRKMLQELTEEDFE